MIDLTDLSDDHGENGIDRLLRDARDHGTAAVCVWPEYVERATQALEGTGVRVATVADFPGGDGAPASVLASVDGSLAAGADEIDLVLPYRLVVAGRTSEAGESVASVADRVHRGGALLKVILETGELGERELVVTAGQLAVDAGADFLKTSTGKTSAGASLDAVDAMIDVVAGADREVGLKPSGGISTVAAAMRYMELVERRLGDDAVTPQRLRFGASSLLADAVSIIDTAS